MQYRSVFTRRVFGFRLARLMIFIRLGCRACCCRTITVPTGWDCAPTRAPGPPSPGWIPMRRRLAHPRHISELGGTQQHWRDAGSQACSLQLQHVEALTLAVPKPTAGAASGVSSPTEMAPSLTTSLAPSSAAQPTGAWHDRTCTAGQTRAATCSCPSSVESGVSVMWHIPPSAQCTIPFAAPKLAALPQS